MWNPFKKINDMVLLPSNDLICAHIANQSYEAPITRKKNIGSFVLDEKISTELSAIYADSQQKICILGLRGTVVTKLKDIISDAQILLNIQGIDPRVKESINMYDAIKRNYQGYAIRVCGHSLGGTLSYIVAKHRNPNRCIAFNPGMSVNTFFFQTIEDNLKKSAWVKNTTTYKILGDIVSTAAFVGETKTFRVKGQNDPFKLHTIDNFVQQEIEHYNTTKN